MNTERTVHAKALTDRERQLAEKYHPLVGRFLALEHLDPSEYYDVAVFGLLKAVRALAQGRVQEGLGFPKIVRMNMKWEILREHHKMQRQKRSGWKIVHMEDEICDYDYCVRLRGEIIADPQQDTARHVERLDLISRAMQAGSQNQRKVMELKVWGLSGEEIAQTLEMSEVAVRARIFKFQRKARKLLKEEPPASAGNTASGKENITSPL